MASTVLFMLADSVAWLFVARGLQGLATGAALSAASAALLDLHPRRDPAGVGLANGVAAAGGIGLGMLVSSLLVQLGSAPRVLAVRRPARAVRDRLRRRLLDARAGRRAQPVPADVRASVPSRRSCAARSSSPASRCSPPGRSAASSSRSARSSRRICSTRRNVIVSGIGIVALAGSAALAQLAARPHRPVDRRQRRLGRARGGDGPDRRRRRDRLERRRTSPARSSAAPASASPSSAACARSSRSIPHEHRAAVMSAFYIVAYASISVPAVLAGLVVGHLGLSLDLRDLRQRRRRHRAVVAFEAWRTRPTRVRALQLTSPVQP